MHMRISNRYIAPAFFFAGLGSAVLGIYGGTVVTGLLGGMGLIVFLILAFMRGMSG